VAGQKNPDTVSYLRAVGSYCVDGDVSCHFWCNGKCFHDSWFKIWWDQQE